MSAKKQTKAQLAAKDTFAGLTQLHPDAHCELDHANAFQLLVATVLSAQSTDKVVNLVTPGLFARFADARALAAADQPEVEQLIGKLGMFRQKSKNIIGLAKGLVERHRGEVPSTLDELVALPGVGRKTANVVLGVAFGKPEGVVVDTHVMRIAQRLGWTKNTDPAEIEADLCAIFPRSEWDMLSHTLIFQGRRVCAAVKPACASCGVADLCPSAYRAVDIGRKPPRART